MWTVRNRTATGPGRASAAGLHDRELDNVPRRAGRADDPEWDDDNPQQYQRLVANPFLALFGMVAWVGAMSKVLEARHFSAFFPALASVVLVLLLPQYHCLDCGATGHVARWRRHSCLAVRLRRELGQPRRARGPTPGQQTWLWALAMAVLAFMAAVVR